MDTKQLTELFSVFSQKGLTEVGGGHGQKGVDFQRHWAIMKMVSLQEEGKSNFLFLFETFQDVAVLDSEDNPTSIQIFQVKKKDRNDWTWVELTKLDKPKPPPKSGRKRTEKPLTDIHDSPIGKLYAVVRSFKEIHGSGYFVSNAGCDLPKADGTNVATSVSSSLAELLGVHVDLASKGLETLHSPGDPKPDLAKINFEKVPLPVDDPGTYVVGIVHNYLVKISPRHAGQARALVDTLLAKIGPLGAKTDSCSNFEEVKKQRGYSRSDLNNAFGSLEVLPDMQSYLESWLTQLQSEGMDFMEVFSIRTAATALYRRQVMETASPEETTLHKAVENWLESNSVPGVILPYFRKAYAELGKSLNSIREPEFYAHFSLKAIRKCVDQI